MGGSTSHAGRLVQQARLERRPKWSQQFLADELCRMGYETTREQIARFERSAPFRNNVALLAAAGLVLKLDRQRLEGAILSDYLSIAGDLSKQLNLPVGKQIEDEHEIPTRFPQMRPVPLARAERY